MSCSVEVCSGKKTTPAEGRKKITFIEQAKKRAECDRLAAYIMTVDLMLNSVLHQVGSLTATAIPFIYSFSGNSAASAPISTFMCP
jgi:hypothetical protein